MFSSRTDWRLAPNRLAALLEQRRRAGGGILDLTESNPTRAGLPYPPDLLDPLAHAAGLAYDPQPRGRGEAREAVAADHARRGITIPADDLVLTASTSEAYAFLFKLLCEPGDEVVVPRPSYPLFEYLAGLESIHPIPYALEYGAGWHVDLDSLAAAVGPRTRAVVTVHPNNPTGSFLKRDEAAFVLDLCARRGLAVISDEVFADYAWRADPARVASLAEPGPALAFALGGLSKSCLLPQLKLAWIAAAGPDDLKRPALERLEVIADTYLSVSTPVQLAAPAILARRGALQDPLRARLRANREALERAAAGTAATVLRAEGGWYAVVQVPATRTEEEWVLALLSREGVLVHPGYFFDFPREAYLVVSLLPPPAIFAEGVARLIAVLDAN